MNAIGKLLTGKRILITGAAGSIGSEMVRQVAKFNPSEMTLIDQAETPMHNIRMMMAHDFGHISNRTIVTSITNKNTWSASSRPTNRNTCSTQQHTNMFL